jgi:hypothetical protein
MDAFKAVPLTSWIVFGGFVSQFLGGLITVAANSATNLFTPAGYSFNPTTANKSGLRVERTYVWLSLWSLTFGATGIHDFFIGVSGSMYPPMIEFIVCVTYLVSALVGVVLAIIDFAAGSGFQAGLAFTLLGDLAVLGAGTFGLIMGIKQHQTMQNQSMSDQATTGSTDGVASVSQTVPTASGTTTAPADTSSNSTAPATPAASNSTAPTNASASSNSTATATPTSLFSVLTML